MNDCPFYGRFTAFIGMRTLLMENHGSNQCALVTNAHAPCYLEVMGQPVDWRTCERIPKLVRDRLAEEP